MILVAEHDPAWPVRFEQLRQEYAQAMAPAGVPVVSIEHVGSTAVPGLAAKPEYQQHRAECADQHSVMPADCAVLPGYSVALG